MQDTADEKFRGDDRREDETRDRSRSRSRDLDRRDDANRDDGKYGDRDHDDEVEVVNNIGCSAALNFYNYLTYPIYKQF